MKNQIHDEIPLFKQVYDFALRRIESGEWKEHEKVPSVRTMAAKMKVHRLTVLKAYQMLKNENHLYVKDKSGYFVQPKGLRVFTHIDNPIVSSYVHKNHLSEIHQVKVDYQFSKALVNPKLLPTKYFSEYLKDVLVAEPEILGTYSTIEGDEELRKQMSSYFIEKNNMHVDPAELIVFSGAQQVIYLVAQTFVKRRDTVLLERPSYSMAIDAFQQQGAEIIPVELSPDGYDISQIEQLMKKHQPRLFYLNPTFQNPTGYTVPTDQRKQLVELAETYGCLLVEDDTNYDIYFDEKPPPPIFSYDTDGYVIYIRGYSKYVSPGLRIAFAACRAPLMNSLKSAKSLADNGAPLLNQKMFLHYFFSERMQTHLEKLRIALSIRKEIMEEELGKSRWKWVSPKGGLNLWVQLPGHIPVELLLDKCLKNSISFVPGEICDPLKERKSWIRLSYSFVNENEIRNGVRKLLRIADETSS